MKDFEIDDWDNINWKKLTEEKARFIFEQAKEHLEKILYASDQIENKAFIVLGFSFAIFTSLIAYIATQFSTMGFLLIPTLVYVGILFIVNSLLVFALKPTAYELTGAPPQLLIKNAIISQNLEYIIIGQAQTYIERIKNNLKQNSKKLTILNIATILLVCSPMLISLFMLFCIFKPLF